MFSVERYRPALLQDWDTVLQNSKNGYFFFDRTYMAYHIDRFPCHSLLVYERRKPVAIFPASVQDGVVNSHGGLSYGGLVTAKHFIYQDLEKIFLQIINYYRAAGFAVLLVKCIPACLSEAPIQAQSILLQYAGAQVWRCDTLSCLMRTQGLRYSQRKRRNIRKGQTLNFVLQDDFSAFWEILEQNLAIRHGVKPVHQLEEIHRLAKSFPQNIQLYASLTPDGNLLAGTVLFLYQGSIHIQYMAANAEGKTCGALDGLIDHLLRNLPYRCFSFGISDYRDRLGVNRGLLQWKEEFGAETFPQWSFRLPLAPYASGC